MSSEVDGSLGVVQGELMRDKRADIQFARKDQAGHFSLQREIRGVAADQILFINADCRKVKRGRNSSAGVREEEDFAPATNGLLGLEHGGIRGRADDGS